MTEKRKEELFFKSLLAKANKPMNEAQINQVIKDFQELGKILDDPEYIKDKSLALSICHGLICMATEGKHEGKMKEGSIMHKLSLRLYDYIERME